jgi:CDP-diacylglycerol--glycerol-3-phosphate 3-phosphatidyltransferase
VIIIGREFAVSGLRSIAAHEGFSINVSPLGKGKMVTQVAAVVGILLGHKYEGWVQSTAKVLLWAVVILALVSMIQYFREFWAKLDTSIKYREKRRLKVKKHRQRLAAERRELGRLREMERIRKQREELDPTPHGQ